MDVAQTILPKGPPVATPAARKTDPETSHLAAEEITASGRRAHQQDQAVWAVAKHHGCASAELAAETGFCRFMLARRLPEAAIAGRVYRGGARKCRVTGRMAMTWWPA